MRLMLALLLPLVGLSATDPQPDADRSSKGLSSGAAVIVGADRLLGEYAHLIRGKSVALVANHSARLSDGTHLADALFRHRESRLVVLFGMEYDIRSNDYAAVRDGEIATDRTTGLTKYNLYGAQHKPTSEMLAGVDVIVFDIQEVGARFYEHINILGFVMEAAAEQGIAVVVLDRPNPITGRKPEGFLPDPVALFRFGSYASVPIVHGMTMGELARLYNGEHQLRGGRTVTLDVVPMQGWSRDMWYDETGLPWRKPSPNLLTAESLLAYVGTCLFEAVNVSEGRGTDHPFEMIGAPWLDGERTLALLRGLALPGVSFETVTFVPEQKAYHGRPPELAGETLRGIRLRVTDRDAFEPYRTGVSMLWAVHALHKDRLVWNDAVLDRLVATPRLKALLQAGRSPADIVGAWSAELAAFQTMSGQYFLYR